MLLSWSQLEGLFTHSPRKAREQWMPCSLCFFPLAQGFPLNLELGCRSADPIRATFCPTPTAPGLCECSDQIWLFTWVQGIKTHVFKGAYSLLSIEYAVLTQLDKHSLLVFKCIVFIFIDKLIWVRTSRCKREFYALYTFLHFHFTMYSFIRAYTCHNTCVEVWGPPVGVSSLQLPCGWVPAINLRLSGLAASTRTYGPILPVLCISYQIMEPLLDTFMIEATVVIKTKEFGGWGVRSSNSVL